MKIISGEYKNRNILGYDIVGTRPTMDRVRESLFAMIQNNIKDQVVLDLFAGSGSLGIESLSNYAKEVYFNDANIKCIEMIKNNLNNLNIKDKAYFLNMDYMKALVYYKKNNVKFNLVFLDPPYKLNIISDIINYMKQNYLLFPKAVIVCEVSCNNLLDNYDNLIKIKMKKYGDKYIIIYKDEGDSFDK